MRLLRPIGLTLVVLVLLSGMAGAQYSTVAELQRCARTDDLIKEVPASCYVAESLKDGNLPKKLGEIPTPAALAKQPLENMIAAGVLKTLEDARNTLEKSAKEAEEFAEVCRSNRPENAANCAALAARLVQYSAVRLVRPAADAASLGGVAAGGKAELAETPSGANADIQAVAAGALNDVLMLPFGHAEGVITLGKAPGDETGLIVAGETALARAAASEAARFKIINDLTPPAGITAAKAQDLYNRMVKAETDGKMELAYTLARAYIISAPLAGAFTERGLAEAFNRANQCLTGGTLVLRGLPFDCSRYKSLRAAVATDIYPGLVTGYTVAAEIISCDMLRNIAETSLWASARLAAARAYIAGRIVPPGIRQPCVEGKDALLRLARTARSAELRAEAAGDLVTLYPESDGPGVPRGRTITILSKPRGLSALLCGITDVDRACKPADPDERLLDDASKDVQLAAWLAVGQAWAKSKARAANWGQATTGKNEAYRRAGTYAYFYPRGLDLVRTYMEPLARGREATVERYALDGTRAQDRRGAGLEVTLLLVAAKDEAGAEKCGNEGRTDEHKAACIEALARLLSGASVSKLIEDANGGSAARSKAAGLVLGRQALAKATEREILNLILRWTVGANVGAKEPLTSGLVEAYGRKLAELVK